ncbi:butyrophilin subfamily 1 member A1-like isoform X1 [Marmota flaviventris]|uniref:butyrophilin subfamily 1 member A1-like isoform X1 n=1 Tax=Marmota flaviventris TaxID=93162 RepID=UPI003A881010
MIQDSPWEDRGLRLPRMQPWNRSLRTLLLCLLLPWPGAGQFDVIGPSSPVIAKVGAEAVFSCHLNPSTDAQDMEIRWFHAKNSELVHYYRNSQDILEKQHPEYHRRTELLKDQISQGQVALRIHPIRTSDGGDYNCSFASSTHHSAAQFSVEVTGDLFPRVSPWTVVLGVLFSLLTLCLVVTGIVLLRTRKAKEKIIEELEQRTSLSIKDLKEARSFAENLILDERTAHPSLYVTQDGQHVYSLSVNQNVPDSPERFTLMPFVLGRNSFSSGSHYWEVQVAGKSRWAIGLCLDSVDRGRAYEESCPEAGFWTLSLKDGQYKVLSMHSYNINVPLAPEVVGIFLQYEEGLISFYNVIELTILFTLKSKFTQPLRPYFYPGPPTPGSTWGLTILHFP